MYFYRSSFWFIRKSGVTTRLRSTSQHRICDFATAFRGMVSAGAILHDPASGSMGEVAASDQLDVQDVSKLCDGFQAVSRSPVKIFHTEAFRVVAFSREDTLCILIAPWQIPLQRSNRTTGEATLGLLSQQDDPPDAADRFARFGRLANTDRYLPNYIWGSGKGRSVNCSRMFWHSSSLRGPYVCDGTYAATNHGGTMHERHG